MTDMRVTETAVTREGSRVDTRPDRSTRDWRERHPGWQCPECGADRGDGYCQECGQDRDE